MALLGDIKKIERLLAKQKKALLGTREDTSPEVRVGYTANYAVYVHEMPVKHRGKPRKSGTGKGNYWDPPSKGQNKFLEQPARELSNDGTLVDIVATAARKGATLLKALLLAGRRLQRDSQKLVPVDTGNLKNSAFTREV